MKKFLSVFFSLIIVVSGLLVVGVSAEPTEVGYLSIVYTEDGNRLVESCDVNATGEIVIPEEVEGVPVTTINWDAFKNCKGITGVVIPDSVTTIGYNAFENCTSLISIVIPDGITNIEFGTFKNCTSLKSVVLSDSVTEIQNNSFEGCSSLETVTLSDNVEEISFDAFKGCINLKTVICSDECFNFSEKIIDSNNEQLVNAEWVYDNTRETTVAGICGLVGLVVFVIFLILFIKKKNKAFLVVAVSVAVVIAIVSLLVLSGVFKNEDSVLKDYREEYASTVVSGECKIIKTVRNPGEKEGAVDFVITCKKGSEQLWEYVKTFSVDYDENEFSIITADNGVISVYLYGSIIILDFESGKELTEIKDCRDIVDVCTDFTQGNVYIAYNGGQDLKVVTTTGKVMFENHYGNEDVITKMEMFESSELDVTLQSGKVDVYDLSEFWRRCIYSVEATSTLAPQGSKTYDAENMLDEDFNTVWSEGVEGSGIGEKIKVTIDPCISTKAFIIICDSESDEEFYEKNNAVKRVRAIDSTGKTQIVNINNSYDYWVELGKGAEWFEIEILEVEKGSTYDDTCITEIRVTENFLLNNH